MARRKPVRLTPQEAALRERAEARVAGMGLGGTRAAVLMDPKFFPGFTPADHWRWVATAPAADLRDWLGLPPLAQRIDEAAALMPQDTPAGSRHGAGTEGVWRGWGYGRQSRHVSRLRGL